ncbi:MAG: AEC family transporter [Oscillospiraceae bacterium]|nr:AEC family transporter [Oscillospiraceae bacterium]
MSLLLFRQIASLFLMVAAGFLIVKLKILSSKDSRVLSLLCIYIVVPCVIVNSFQLELTESVRNNFLLAVCAALLIHAVIMLLGFVLKAMKLDAVGRGSVMYSNSGNLVIPLVLAILGSEWVIYSSAFMCVQLVFMWTHGNALISGQTRPQWKKIVTNCNLIAIALGLVLMLLRIRLPSIVTTAMDSLGDMLGPMSMLLVGMLLAEADLKAIFTSRETWLIAFLKMIALPLVVLVVLKLTGLAGLVPEGRMVLYISFLAVSAPTATMITQLSQLYRNRPDYASAINVMTTLLCILTMPLMTEVYMRFM